LHWLRAGVNSFGSAGGNAIVFPAGPAHAGGFSLESKEVTFKLFREAHGLIAGKPITAPPERLDPDISGHPSTGEMGSLPFHVIGRGDRVGNPRKDLSGAAARHFHGLMLYPLDMSYRVTATGVPSHEKDERCAECFGRLFTTGAGGEYHSFPDQRSGREVDCCGRRSCERSVFCLQ